MYYLTERNERRTRRTAFWLAITAHLALGSLLYLSTSTPEQPAAPAKPKVTYPHPTKPSAPTASIEVP